MLTIHRSKGLEFPIVYLPVPVGARATSRDSEPVFFHDADGGRPARRSTSPSRAPTSRAIASSTSPSSAARTCGWRTSRSRARGTRRSCGGRARGPAATRRWAGCCSRATTTGTSRPRARSPPATPRRSSVSGARRGARRAASSVERSRLGMPRGGARAAAAGELAAAAFERTLDQRWRRTSYTDITAGAYEAGWQASPRSRVVATSPTGRRPPRPRDAARRRRGRPARCWPRCRAGAEVGTVVHRVLAASEFAAADLDSELERQIAAAQARRAVDLGEPEAVVGGLRAAIETPLGPLLGGLRLRDVARADRLDELEFELPLAGGDQPDGWLTLSAIARRAARAPERGRSAGRLCRAARRPGAPAERPRVSDGQPRPRGPATGTADAPRFAVLDYKTNWLGAPGEELTVEHYRPDALAAEMYRHHYALQALLYTVALHRYLRWRRTGLLRRAQHGGRSVSVPARDGRRPEPRACSPGSRRRRWSQALSDALDRGSRAMSALGVQPDPFDARRVRSVDGLVREFNDAGVLASADVHVAARLAAIARERHDSVVLAAALAVRVAAAWARARRPRLDSRHGGGRHRGADRPVGAAVARRRRVGAARRPRASSWPSATRTTARDAR